MPIPFTSIPSNEELQALVRSAEMMAETGVNTSDWRDLARAAKNLSKCIDPPDCGCTDCLIGYSRPAKDYDEYVKAERLGLSR